MSNSNLVKAMAKASDNFPEVSVQWTHPKQWGREHTRAVLNLAISKCWDQMLTFQWVLGLPSGSLKFHLFGDIWSFDNLGSKQRSHFQVETLPLVASTHENRLLRDQLPLTPIISFSISHVMEMIEYRRMESSPFKGSSSTLHKTFAFSDTWHPKVESKGRQ